MTIDLDRLAKLYALTESDQVGEAHAALAATKALLAKHNKTMRDIPALLGAAPSQPARTETTPDWSWGPFEPREELITARERKQLLNNALASRKAGKRLDHKPVVKLVGKWFGDVWLTEMSPDDEDQVYGLIADWGNRPTNVATQVKRLSDLIANMLVSADGEFVADRPLSEYAAEQRAEFARLGAIYAEDQRVYEATEAKAKTDAARVRREATEKRQERHRLVDVIKSRGARG